MGGRGRSPGPSRSGVYRPDTKSVRGVGDRWFGTGTGGARGSQSGPRSGAGWRVSGYRRRPSVSAFWTSALSSTLGPRHRGRDDRFPSILVSGGHQRSTDPPPVLVLAAGCSSRSTFRTHDSSGSPQTQDPTTGSRGPPPARVSSSLKVSGVSSDSSLSCPEGRLPPDQQSLSPSKDLSFGGYSLFTSRSRSPRRGRSCWRLPLLPPSVPGSSTSPVPWTSSTCPSMSLWT